MTIDSLEDLAKSLNLTIKIQIREVFGLKFFRIVVARITNNYVKIFGEIKGWTIPNKNGLQLDTLRILRDSPEYVSELIWATAMA